MKKILLGVGEPQEKFTLFKGKYIKKKMEKLYEYPNFEGKLSFKKSISKWINKRNNISKVFIKNISPSIGNKEAIYTITNYICNKDSREYLISPDPFYSCYNSAKLFFRRKIIFISSENKKEFMYEFNRIKKKVFKNIFLMFICSPSNPTGFLFNKSELIKIINTSIKYNFYIISDECYSEIYNKKKPVSCVKIIENYFNGNYNNVFIINSLSKTSSLPGLRSGFILSSNRNIKQINFLRRYNGTALSNFNQDLSSKIWLNFSRTKKIRKKYNEIFNLSRKIFNRGKIKFKIPEGGFYIWLDIKDTGLNSEDFCKKIKKKYKIVILPGKNFSLKKKNIYKIRISLVESKKKCIFALKKIVNFINEYKR
ncbi:aminotransferase class I/II-fold pyridoxal phosphate-dependent enzyme [Candidatus Vidania fulgoroideorum]